MTLKEFRWTIKHMKPKDVQPTVFARRMLTHIQERALYTDEAIHERNVRKGSPSFWSRIFIEQCWRIMWPGEKRK